MKRPPQGQIISRLAFYRDRPRISAIKFRDHETL
jgi:hypothetical protein